jgi:hypothetical protein
MTAGEAVLPGAGCEVALGSAVRLAGAPLAVGAGAPEPDGSPPRSGTSADGGLPPGAEGDGLDGDVTVTVAVTVGSGPFAVDALKAILHVPAGSCVVTVHTPLTGVPAVSESATVLVPKVAVTAEAGLPAVET